MNSTLRTRLRSNPVLLKELRSRMRTSRAFWVLTAYLLLLCASIGLVFLAYRTIGVGEAYSPAMRQALGKTLFGTVVGMELLTVSFIAPALTAGAISSEREALTYDLLRTTLLPARALVFGKLLSALCYVFLLLFIALPLQSLAFLYGGISSTELLVANLLLGITALSFATVGLFFSSSSRRTLVSTILSYAFAILVIFGLPILLIAGLGLFASQLLGSVSELTTFAGAGLLLAGWFLISINPLAAAAVAESVYIEQGAVVAFNLPLSQGAALTLVSPWISFTILHLSLSVFLIWMSIRLVQRAEKQ